MRCLGYLAATDAYGLTLGTGGDTSITCDTDSDWASNPMTRQSIGDIAWTSNRQVFWLYRRLNLNI